jgi:diamine N-acetyltransferase
MLEIVDATPADVPAIKDMAERTWRVTYSQLLSKEQLSYMLTAIYSEEGLRRVMDNKSQQFIIIREDGASLGFAAYGPLPDDPSVFKLHKLYLLPETHGLGLGKKLLDEVKRRTVASGRKILDLNVKRDNPAKYFYEKCGFTVVREVDIPFGPYMLEDYIMRIEL